MLKKLLLVLLLSVPFASFGQQHVLFRDSTTIDSFRLTMWVRQLIPPAVPKINPFFDSLGSAYLAPNGIWWRHNGVVWQPLATEPDSARWATRRYVDSTANSISAGAVDTNNYIASITRLNREIDSVSNIIDSNNAIIYGSISALYDTLQNYVDTAQLNDSLRAIKAAYVPYTGATADVNLGTHNILPNSVRLSTTPTGTLTNVGQMYWDAANVTASMPLNANVTMQVGQEMYIRARNNTGVQINDGQVVYVNNALGNTPTIALANSDSVSTSEVIGVATENIADNTVGFVTVFGVVNGYNTSGFSDGDILYLSDTNGQLTNVIPSPPHNVVKLGVALNTTVNGKIFIHPSEPLSQDTTFTAPYNSNKVAPTQLSAGTFVRNIINDTASDLRAAINTKGSGSVTSITGGYGLTGGTITTTGTFAVDSNLQATRARVKKQIDSVAALTGGGGGSPVLGTPYHLLFPTGTDTLKTTDKAYIDTTDNRLVFTNDTTTTSVNTDPNGGTKVFGSNRMGMSALRLLDTVSIPAALQRALNAQTVGTMLPFGANIAYGGMFQAGTTGMFQVQVATNVAYGGTYDATNQQQNYSKVLYSTSTAANNVFFVRTTSLTVGAGIMVGATAYSGGSGRGTFTFALPAYNSGQRIFIGYSTSLSAIMTTNDPSAAASIAMLAIAKDAGDATLSWLYNDGTGTPTKVSTGVTPNQNDMYRLTVYVSPKGHCWMQLEVMTKTSNTIYVVNPTTDIPAGVKIVPQQSISNAATGAVVTYGLNQFIEEIY